VNVVSRRLLRSAIVAALACGLAVATAEPVLAEGHGRIQWKPSTPAQLARRASEDAMNDGILRMGDVISTDRGFLLFRGYAADGSPDFAPVRNPLDNAAK